MNKIFPVILCGGSGRRLWPLSKDALPKQFIKINTSLSPFQECISNLARVRNSKIQIVEFVFVTNEEQRFLVIEQIDELKLGINYKIILEPKKRNTAPALTLAALSVIEEEDNGKLVVLPSDIYFKNKDELISKLIQGVELKSDDSLITFGLKITRPDIGYGYIERDNNIDVSDVVKFTEKPDLALAEQYMSSGNHVWNAGIFLMSASKWLYAVSKLAPKIYNNTLKSWQNRVIDKLFVRPDEKNFLNSPEDSIDYAVAQKANQISLKIKNIILESEWIDLGSFLSIEGLVDSDEDNNHYHGNITSHSSSSNIALSQNRHIALLGVNDLVVMGTKESTLVASKKSLNQMRELTDKIKEFDTDLVERHHCYFKPWGWYEVINKGPGFVIKIIYVKPKSKLSYQSHDFRSEHWVILQGKAKIKINGINTYRNSGESIYINAKDKHQLENNTNGDLFLIEVQMGHNLSEDDIVRFEDDYGRSDKSVVKKV